MTDTLSFPPLFTGQAAQHGADPFATAVSNAMMGCDPGLIIHNQGGDELKAAIVLTPESALEEAMAMVFAAGLGFSDALGALAPPEVGVHMVWPDQIFINGARCGRLRAAASTRDAQSEPDWLVVGFELPLVWPGGAEPGTLPDRTVLMEEGCADVDPLRLLESWSRHTLVWINEWLDRGMGKLHADWRGRAMKIGEDVSIDLNGVTHGGLFVGIDERGGMLLRDGEETRLIPLSSMLED